MGGAHRIWSVEKKVKLSIIVPVYNVAPYLRACLDSLVAASEKVKSEKGVSAEVEVICVDDGSTDGSAEILDEFQSEYDAKSCPIRAAWRQAWNEGLLISAICRSSGGRRFACGCGRGSCGWRKSRGECASSLRAMNGFVLSFSGVR